MLEQHQEFSGLQITDLQLQAFLMRSYVNLFLVQHFQHILSKIWYEITTDNVATVTIVNTSEDKSMIRNNLDHLISWMLSKHMCEIQPSVRFCFWIKKAVCLRCQVRLY